ncbi:hypothetical protein M2132_002184 [Dysgonomonas sp. PH5-45]|uniref:hypothetical protein n=1 Tax=unclassified Dysgonomonas TaxID=2630389 RepID=UPI0024763330|nr:MULTISPECIES: hypothetical protein [unclassified Dysgonomonas]MDH6355834.1 hypothetical protein [Dysgonomonas sp. PH5-45]MDH6388738.1 hypothetical protein [Dysgonomonas sp. PH5-37]
MAEISNHDLFNFLYFSKTEKDVENVIQNNPNIFIDDNWLPLGGNENMFGIVRNQQSSPIAALVEKVTNSIDAILTKKCLESGIQPDSNEAPQSMEEALSLFYPDYKNWDLKQNRRRQSEDIQIIADGPTRETSVIIYDNGEGQHPEKFEDTFLSLVRGNKINIQFVQGKYNMGGSGALVFCGKKRYQLIASKRFDGTGNFGFTLIRQRKIGDSVSNRRSSHFEYLKIDNQIPSFPIDYLDLKLHGRNFKTGSIIKMYSYQFPSGYSGFAQDLNQSLNEFLFEPTLPILTVDTKERYPNNKVLELDLYGLKRRLEESQSEYIDTYFSEEYVDELFGKAKVTCYVFKPKTEKYDVKKSKEIIRSRFFKNNMSVMFSINGQVHGSYTAEFITRTLKFNLLKDYLLIHIDCTGMDPDFREELFMASRDRLKQGEEAYALRDYLGKKLRKSHLDEINRRRKDSIGLENEDTTELIKSFAKNLPKDSDLFKLLQNTLKLEEKREEKKEKKPATYKPKTEVKPFLPQRFPTFFKLHNKKEGLNIISLPKNGEKTIKFNTDVENDYFDRSEYSGDLEISILQARRNNETGGTQEGSGKDIAGLLNIVKSSPNKGTIKLTIEPRDELNVGDEIEIKASLTAPGEAFEEIILVKVSDKEAPKEKIPQEDESEDHIGLPKLHKVKEDSWGKLEENGIEMGYDTVMHPVSEGDQLQEIYINLDSKVFLNHRSKLKGEEQILVAEKKYISSVYFHTLFLYMITKRRKYSISVEKETGIENIAIDEYIKDVFDNYYSDFLLNFGMEQLMGALED